MLSSREESILTLYSREWQRFSKAVHRIDAACMYVNKLTKLVIDESFPEHRKSFVVHVDGRRMELRPKPIGPLGLYLWKHGVLLHSRDEHQNMILQQIMKALGELRTLGKSTIDPADLEATIKSFHECDSKEFYGPVEVPLLENRDEMLLDLRTLYETDLEPLHLRLTAEFYRQESAQMIEKEDITGYVRYAEGRLRQELQLTKTLFPMSSTAKIISAVEESLVLAHTTIIQQAFVILMEKHASEELKIIFQLLQRIPDGIAQLAKSFGQLILQRGQRLLLELPEGSSIGFISNYVQRLSAVYQQFEDHLKGLFDSNALFGDQLLLAFQQLLSSSSTITNPPGMVLAEFLHLSMLDEIMPDEQSISFDDMINGAVKLLEALPDKEPFIQNYIHLLAQRLLYRLSRHGESETRLVVIIGVCGHEVQIKMQRMFSDMHTSLEIRNRLQEVFNPTKTPEITVSLPSYVVWPLPLQADPKEASYRLLPSGLEREACQFETFYRKGWASRNLTWLHHLSRITMDYRTVEDKKYELTVTVPQAYLLNCFQHVDCLPVKDLCSRMELSTKELQAVINPMLQVGLVAWNGDPTIDEDNIQLSLYREWKYPKNRLRLCHFTLGPSIHQDTDRESFSRSNSLHLDPSAVESPSPGATELAENKKYFLQCTIVRILKEHREVAPNRLGQLIERACSQPGPVSFLPTATHIASALEALMEKQYVEFEARRNLYIYMP